VWCEGAGVVRGSGCGARESGGGARVERMRYEGERVWCDEERVMVEKASTVYIMSVAKMWQEAWV